jgi:cold-inducible RNA-binding protein
MGTKLYVGNLSYETEESVVQELFSQTGTVSEVVLIRDRDTRRSRGFAFVTMASETEAQAAISANNGREFEGRPLVVNEAKPRENRPSQGDSSARNRRRPDSWHSHDRKGRGNSRPRRGE